MTTVVIPAHNESTTIARTLNNLPDLLPIIVVCNGCTDDTADVARSINKNIQVIETPVPSKTNALNLGDNYVRSYPVIYLDADVVLKIGSVERIQEELAKGNIFAVSPYPKMDFTNSSWLVKAYYKIWLSLPYSKNGMIGSGCYALSQKGRQRFEKFPDIIADDGYVRALFTEVERSNVRGSHSIVSAPSSLSWLIKIKTRSRLGRMQLSKTFPELLGNEEKNYRLAMFELLKQPSQWFNLPIYLYVNLLSRFLAANKLKKLSGYQWEKDLSSRELR